jgi:hypothetical protein
VPHFCGLRKSGDFRPSLSPDRTANSHFTTAGARALM